MIEIWGLPTEEKTIAGRKVLVWQRKGGGSIDKYGNFHEYYCAVTVSYNAQKAITQMTFHGTRNLCGSMITEETVPPGSLEKIQQELKTERDSQEPLNIDPANDR